ncbi:hypothetical protein JQM34_000158 [Streptococcus oralis]|uniref:hypothetical protein n=1 Tax=Streptococcus oralis TaxID=1303 RepID=UPI001908EF9C|nr:hypothetical protein [Streptococcus oralis]MDU7196074.1 hypothetical protein [Streptococcus sp.]QQL00809.1 hypothetical protein JDY60_02035 [Streptococcus oralis]QRO06741.1 hypothetical protein JQM34_000158 [Streptococcus oralis]
MNKEEFLKIKEAYKSARTEERKSIIDFITKKKDEKGNYLFTKSKDKPYNTRNQYSGGGGNKKYTSGSRLSRPYDLSNHMWIDLNYKGNDILISLQSFDIDPNSHNLHVLYDRIGIIFEKDEESDDKDGKPDNELKVSDDFLKMETTNWELPLSEADMEEMVDYIINHYEE